MKKRNHLVAFFHAKKDTLSECLFVLLIQLIVYVTFRFQFQHLQ